MEPDWLLPTYLMSLQTEVRLNKTSGEFYVRLYMYRVSDYCFTPNGGRHGRDNMDVDLHNYLPVCNQCLSLLML